MIKTAIKLIFITIISTSFLFSCGNNSKNKPSPLNTNQTEVVDKKTKRQEQKVYYTNAVKEALNSKIESPYRTGDKGVKVFIKGNELICFLDVKDETPSIYEDRFYVNIYFKAQEREALGFEFMDFEKDDIKIDGNDYMLAAFKMNNFDFENTTVIQVGQIGKQTSKVLWKVENYKSGFYK